MSIYEKEIGKKNANVKICVGSSNSVQITRHLIWAQVGLAAVDAKMSMR